MCCLGKPLSGLDAAQRGCKRWSPGAEGSASIRPVDGGWPGTDLVIKVNGVRIAARGGNWGMDDMLKRVSAEHLEPYFRLHRDAHVNMIRNWMGQNTEESLLRAGRQIRIDGVERFLGIDGIIQSGS